MDYNNNDLYKGLTSEMGTELSLLWNDPAVSKCFSLSISDFPYDIQLYVSYSFFYTFFILSNDL